MAADDEVARIATLFEIVCSTERDVEERLDRAILSEQVGKRRTTQGGCVAPCCLNLPLDLGSVATVERDADDAKQVVRKRLATRTCRGLLGQVRLVCVHSKYGCTHLIHVDEGWMRPVSERYGKPI